MSGNKYFGVYWGGYGLLVSGSRFVFNGGVGLYCFSCALSQNTFDGNNAAGTQWTVSTVKDMGGNACFDHACP